MIEISVFAVLIPALTALVIGFGLTRNRFTRPHAVGIAFGFAVLIGTYANPPWDARKDKVRRHWHWFGELAVVAGLASLVMRSNPGVGTARSGRPPCSLSRFLVQLCAFILTVGIAAWWVVPNYNKMHPTQSAWRAILIVDIGLLYLCLGWLKGRLGPVGIAVSLALSAAIVSGGIGALVSFIFAIASFPIVAAFAGCVPIVILLKGEFSPDALIFPCAVLLGSWGLVAAVEPARPLWTCMLLPWSAMLMMALGSIPSTITRFRARKRAI